MANLNVGVIIGRFQVPQLHAGHLKLITSVAERNDRVVMLLGVSPVDGHTPENPLSFDQRKSMVTAWTSPLGYHHTLTVIPLFDRRTNEEWSKQIDVLLTSTYPTANITLYGGRQSFIQSYCGALKVESVAFCPQITDAGTEHRAAIKEDTSPLFLAGQIYAMQQQYPKAHATVDFALLRRFPGAERGERDVDEQVQVLLIQRADTGIWCIPGGFVDPTDESFELAAKRELNEEVGLSVEGRAYYICTRRLNDWRYRSSRDKIITTLFAGWYSWGEPRPNPKEVQDYQWSNIHQAATIVGEVHIPLIETLVALQKTGVHHVFA